MDTLSLVHLSGGNLTCGRSRATVIRGRSGPQPGAARFGQAAQDGSECSLKGCCRGADFKRCKRQGRIAVDAMRACRCPLNVRVQSAKAQIAQTINA